MFIFDQIFFHPIFFLRKNLKDRPKFGDLELVPSIIFAAIQPSIHL